MAGKHKQAEAEQRENEARWRTILDQSRGFIGLASIDGTLIEVNRSAMELVGASAADVLKKPLWETPWWSHSTALQEQLRAAIRTAAAGDSVRFEATHPGADGNVRHVDFSLQPLKDETGNTLFLILEGHDITDRKQAEEAVRQSRNVLDQVLNTIPQSVFWKDRDSRYLGCNLQFARAIGLESPDGIVGKTDFDLPWPKEEADAYRNDDRFVMDNNCPKPHIIEPLQQADGSRLWIDTSKMPLVDGQGHVYGVLGVYEDITEKKQMEEALRQNERRLSFAISATADAVWEWNLRTNATYYSPRWYEMLGYGDGQFPMDFDAWKALCHPDDFQPTIERIQATLSVPRGTGYVAEFRMRRADGSWVWILGRGNVVERDAEGRPTLLSGTNTDITERKQAEEALLRSEASFRAIFDVFPHPIVLNSFPDGAYIDVNPAFERFDGHRRDEVIGLSAADLGIDTDPETRQKIVACLAATGRVDNELHRMATPDGNEIWIIYSTRLMEMGGERVALTVLTDVSELKRTEKALLESEERFRSTFEQAAVGIAHLSPDGRFLRTNQRFCDIVGYTQEEIVILTFQDITYPADLEADMGHLRELIDGLISTYSMEKRYIRKDGSLVWANLTVALLREPDGSPKYFISVIEDIGRRKEAEEALRLNAQRLETLLELNHMTGGSEGELAPFAMEAAVRLTRSAIGYIAFMNEDETVLTMYAWSRKAMQECEVIDKPFMYPVAGTGLWGEAVRQRRAVITNDYAAPNPLKKGLPEGHVRITRHMNVPIFDGDRIVVVAGVGNKPADYGDDDVRQLTLLMSGMWTILRRRRAEEAIATARRQLEAKNKELGQLVYVASHDLRSPLVNVDGFSRELEYSLGELGGLLEGGGDPESLKKSLRTTFPDMEKALGRIRTSTRQMDNLLKGLLKLSRAGRAALRIEAIDMNELLGQLVSSFAFRVKEEGIELTVEDLPPCRGDSVQVTQVFSNLIDNAIKYRDKGRPGVIMVKGSAGGGRSLYRVVDNGVGIADNHQENIFELFHRLNPKETEGEGLGLTMARQMLGRMDGEIAVESKPGKGSAFIVNLPGVEEENATRHSR